MSTTLVVNPRDDTPFVALAERLVADGVRSPRTFRSGFGGSTLTWSSGPESSMARRSRSGTSIETAIGSLVPGGTTEEADVSELENDLRATAEDIAADATRLAAIEEEKAGLETDDPRLVELSAEGEAIARRLVPKTVPKASWPPRHWRPTVRRLSDPRDRPHDGPRPCRSATISPDSMPGGSRSPVPSGTN